MPYTSRIHPPQGRSRHNIFQIMKSDNEVTFFDEQKLKRSIARALQSAGIKDNPISGNLVDEVIKKLSEELSVKEYIKTADIREAVEITFLERGLTEAAHKYHDFIIEKDKRMKGKSRARTKQGLQIPLYFSKEGRHPFDQIEWEKRKALIINAKGETVYEQDDVEVPKAWSQSATNIVASKYFYGDIEKGTREQSVKQLIDRVTRTITEWGIGDGYFATPQDAENFYHELTFLIVNQYGTFNSPVWFNCGVHRYDTGSGVGRYYWDKKTGAVKLADDDYIHPQCSACFILDVADTMDSILDLAKAEGMVFKFGSGTGYNLSPIRSSYERLSGGGNASGPVSFMKGYDAFAGVIKSGGKTRRAAKMVILNVDHPDIVEFIDCKVNEEKKAWALIDAGYDGSMDGEAYTSVFFQNANHSVRVTDQFMKKAVEDGEWQTRAVTSGEVLHTYKAKDLLRKIAEGTHLCGDPGLQYDTTINNWHTCLNADRIHSSNPCSEYMFLNNTACNLASLNLMKFIKSSGTFDIKAFQKAVDIFFIAQDIIIDNASYPTAAIAERSHIYRTVGLGYANLGALLMSLGFPYDSDSGRNLASSITALMTGEAYLQSARIAEIVGPFSGFEENRDPTCRVMEQHYEMTQKISDVELNGPIRAAAVKVWEEVVEKAKNTGLRNAQATVLAPTGTIAFMMDCDTTGIEPDIALVKYKKLVGGGYMKIVNSTVDMALRKLGYTEKQIREILDFIDREDTIEGAPHITDEHLAVFDCAFRPAKGSRTIHYIGHIKMMGAVQPFISGAISKTVNMPKESTVEDIMEAYIEGWKLGLKALAIYRDGSKRIQPLNTSREKNEKPAGGTEKAVDENTYATENAHIVKKPRRRRLPDERRSITHKFTIGNHKGYLTVGLYDDGMPGEIFVTMAKEGSVISGLMDAFATSISIALQYGVPLKVLINKFVHMRFEPSGYTNNAHIKIAKSVVDYIFRWLAMKFLTLEEQLQVGVKPNGNGDSAGLGNGFDHMKLSLSKQAPLTFAKNKPEKAEKDTETSTTPQARPTDKGTDDAREMMITFDNQADAPACDTCGTMMVRNGSCYECLNCGATSGCS